MSVESASGDDTVTFASLRVSNPRAPMLALNEPGNEDCNRPLHVDVRAP